jgi:glycosyl hydrolase family 2
MSPCNLGIITDTDRTHRRVGCAAMLIRSSFALAFTMAILLSAVSEAQGWNMQPLQIQTRWAALVSPTNALPAYPRPQMVRAHWVNLNGLWSYAITAKDAPMPAEYQGHILVPYPLESALSGVQKPLRPDQALWYRHPIAIERSAKGRRTLLNFGAVDYQATVYLNAREIGTHAGGYQHFTFDITDALRPGQNELVVKVYDPTDQGPNPHGKQGLQYTATSGIWQTVWLETVPKTYIEGLGLTPDVDHIQLHLQVNLNGNAGRLTVLALIKRGSALIRRQTVRGNTALPVTHPHLWSPDDPFLYDLEVRLLKDGKVIDEVKSYFGLRKVEVKKDSAGMMRMFLNDRYIFNLGVLDQGFWPDGIYTAPTDAALKFDIQAAKAMGFNTIRKHIKIEPDRWYYYCDTLGMLVWQDMVNPADRSAPAREAFEKEIPSNVAQLYNHPSITTWVLFNEAFGGGYDHERLARMIKQLDGTRLLNSHSGPYESGRLAQWFRHLAPGKVIRLMHGDPQLAHELSSQRETELKYWIGGDMTDIHAYPDPQLPPAAPGKAQVLGEFGGTGVVNDGHIWNDLIDGRGYLDVRAGQLGATYAGMIEKLKTLEAQGLSGSIYTQITDIEQEQNGLLTYDRALTKIPLAEIAAINAEMVPKASNYLKVTRGFSALNGDLVPQSQRYAALLAEYRGGKRDPIFLRHLTLMALRQKDEARATQAGNAYIDQLQQPYSRDDWAFIAAVTRTSHDLGFEILRAQMSDADAVLGANAAEIAVRRVIEHDEIEPLLAAASAPPDWPKVEKQVIERFGPLGAEAVYGAEMLYAVENRDWIDFGKYYVLYFDTAVTRTEYPINNISFALSQHVDDPKALDTAIRILKASIDAGSMGVFGRDLTEIDTYASLLYRAGRVREALEWETKAVALSEGRDAEFEDHLKKMQAGQPMWPAS